MLYTSGLFLLFMMLGLGIACSGFGWRKQCRKEIDQGTLYPAEPFQADFSLEVPIVFTDQNHDLEILPYEDAWDLLLELLPDR